MAQSAMQPFKHALPAQEMVLPGECPASLDELRASLCEQYQPCTVTESILVNEIAEQFWRLRRMRAAEARSLQPGMVDSSLQSGVAALIARTMVAAERGMHKAIATLEKLQADRRVVPSTDSVPSKTSKTAETPKPPDASIPDDIDFGDIDVENILADTDEELHPIVLEAQRMRMRAPRQGEEPAALCGARLTPQPFCAGSSIDLAELAAMRKRITARTQLQPGPRL